LDTVREPYRIIKIVVYVDPIPFACAASLLMAGPMISPRYAVGGFGILNIGRVLSAPVFPFFLRSFVEGGIRLIEGYFCRPIMLGIHRNSTHQPHDSLSSAKRNE
jgi:hypothetical protein